MEGTQKTPVRAILIAVGCFLMNVFILGMLGATKSQFIVYISEDMGWQNSFFTLCISISSFIISVISFVFVYVRKVLKSLRLVLITGIVLYIIAYLLAALAPSKVTMVLWAVITGIAFAFLADIPISIFVHNWFPPDKQGRALGLIFTGSGVGGMIFNPIVQSLVAHYGWRTSFIIMVSIAVVGVLPIIILGKERPNAQSGANAQVQKEEAAKEQKFGLSTVLKLPNMIIFLLVSFFTGFSMGPIYANIAPMLKSAGIEMGTVSVIMSAVYFILILSKIVVGILNDKVGVKFTVTLQTVTDIIGCIIMLIILNVYPSPVLGFSFAFFFGIAYSWQSLTPPTSIKYMYDAIYFSSVVTVMQAMTHLGGAVSPFVASLLKEATGSYNIILIAYASLVFICIFGYHFLFHRIDKELKARAMAAGEIAANAETNIPE
ncbi:MAG: MFS transporter [Lachnospiraceae bacterium]|nr:MFS transporter [Lachnospiraceae bacterium]